MILFGYWRSSAAYRVRIALALKGLAYETRGIDLRHGMQGASEFLARNPQGRVPWLEDGAVGLSQSLAIIEYLDETYPAPPLLPAEPGARARVRAAALTIACDIHPLGNLSVLRRLRDQFGADQAATDAFAAHWIAEGFRALEQGVADWPFLFGDGVTLADICLVPQMANARRFGVDLAAFPKLVAADAGLRQLPAFEAARPELQLDAAV